MVLCNIVTPQHSFKIDKLYLEAENSKKSKSVNFSFPPSNTVLTSTLGSAGSGLESRKRRDYGGSALEKAFNNEVR